MNAAAGCADDAAAVRRVGRWLVFVVACVGALTAPASAHDVAGELRVSAFVRAEPDRVNLVVRLPLELLLNVDLPKNGSGYLDLSQVDTAFPRVLKAAAKDIEVFADGEPLAMRQGQARIALPSDKSFQGYEQALAAVRGARLPPDTPVYWNQGYLDAVLEFAPVAPDASLALDFHVARGLRDRLKMDLRYLTPGGDVRAMQIATGSGRIVLDPRWTQAAASFIASGWRHILGGADHLLFLVCLLLPWRRVDWRLVGVVSAFTLAHSATLVAAAYGLVPGGNWFAPLVETLIAASILYLAIENVLRPNLRWRWLVAAGFGLVHGFGFSFALVHELQYAGTHLLVSLLAFNVGVELGQLFVLALAWPLLLLATRRLSPAAQRMGIVVVGVLVAHAAWHWTSERFDALLRADLPELDAALLARAAVVALLLLAGGLLVKALRRRAPTLGTSALHHDAARPE